MSDWGTSREDVELALEPGCHVSLRCTNQTGNPSDYLEGDQVGDSAWRSDNSSVGDLEDKVFERR